LTYPDIGSYVPISVYPDISPDIGAHDVGIGPIGCPDILLDIVPDIMNFPQPVLLFPAAAATAAAYSMLRNPCD
jgi:hypothetical protein